MHDELAQQAGRPSNGCEFRACGDTRTLNPDRPAICSISRSPSAAGKPGIGYGFWRGGPRKSSSGPDTPSSDSAASNHGARSE
jgi:hypothetical protein